VFYDNYHKNTNYISEINNNQYLIVGNRVDSTLLSDKFYILLDSTGAIIKDSLLIDTTANMSFTSVLRRNKDELLLFGVKMKKNVANDSVQIYYYDNNMNYKKRYSYRFSMQYQLAGLRTSIDSKGNIIFSGSGFVDNVRWRSFIMKIDTNNNIIARNDTFYTDRSELKSVIDLVTDSCYLVFGKGLSFVEYPYQMYKFDYNLNLLSMDSVRNGLTDFYNPIYYRKNEIIHTGQITDHYANTSDFGVCILDSNLESKYFRRYGVDDTTEFPAGHESISKYNNNVYIGATYNMEYLGQDCTKYMLIKMDTNYNVIWKKFYLGEDYDYMVSVIATSDGGCLMGGLHIDMHPESDNTLAAIRLLKIDSNGVITWTKDINPEQVKLNLFPNPTTDYVNIEVKGSQQIKELSIIDINGKQVLKKQINTTHTRLDIRRLAKGLYIIEGVMKNGSWFSEKFVKE